MNSRSFDPIWDDIYRSGHANRYPWDSVVSFVINHSPAEVPRRDVSILEVGCGAASNLWFAAREGFSVAGIDASEEAIVAARQRFKTDGLDGDLRQGNFMSLPFKNEQFDLVIDRGSLVCVGRSDAKRAVHEIHRCLNPKGRFLFNPYSERHTSSESGRSVGDGLVTDISKGSLVGVGQLCFYSRTQIEEALVDSWTTVSCHHIETVESLYSDPQVHAEWRVILEKD
jgi:SAM-dependent methyltransferase